MSKKVCSKCGVEKPLKEFYKAYDKRRPECKVCSRKYAKENINNKTGNNNARLKRTYGINIDDYFMMLDLQDGKCAICGSEKSFNKGRPARLSVDHDHSKEKGEKGYIRGLLCSQCNLLLTKHVTPEILRKAADYLDGDYRYIEGEKYE